MRVKHLVDAVAAGDPRALSRSLTLVECQSGLGRAVLNGLKAHVGRAQILGVTGPPGAGKSTLVDQLIHNWRGTGERVAVLAVDPVSPLTGGAVLGDRTRMGAHSLDDGVFIRSVCSRGHLGGLSAATHEMADLLDAAGWPLIIIETVGAGQSEVDIARAADLSLVVSAPGLGDDLQAMKAGVLEIADVLVVNKADREDAAVTARQLEKMLMLRAEGRRDVPVHKVSATTGEGLEALSALLAEKLKDSASRAQRPRDAYRHEVRRAQFAKAVTTRLGEAALPEPGSEEWEALLGHVVKRVTDLREN